MNEHREEKVEREREYRVITVRRLKSIVDRRHTGIVACVIPYTEYIDATTKAGRHIKYYRFNRVRGERRGYESVHYPPSLVSIPLPPSHTTYRAPNHLLSLPSVHRMIHRAKAA